MAAPETEPQTPAGRRRTAMERARRIAEQWHDGGALLALASIGYVDRVGLRTEIDGCLAQAWAEGHRHDIAELSWLQGWVQHVRSPRTPLPPLR